MQTKVNRLPSVNGTSTPTCASGSETEMAGSPKNSVKRIASTTENYAIYLRHSDD